MAPTRREAACRGRGHGPRQHMPPGVGECRGVRVLLQTVVRGVLPERGVGAGARVKRGRALWVQWSRWEHASQALRGDPAPEGLGCPSLCSAKPWSFETLERCVLEESLGLLCGELELTGQVRMRMRRCLEGAEE